MLSLRTLVVAGLATLVVGLVVAFPARLAWRWVEAPGVSLQGISGTIWTGHAREASAGGLYLTDVRWRFQPLALFGGRLEYGISAAPLTGFVEADVAVSPGGAIRLQDVAAQLPVAALDPFIEVAGLAGDVDLRIARLVFEDGLPVEAEGTIALTALVIRPLAASPLGDYEAKIGTVDGVIRGAVADASGVLEVSGNLELHPDRSYLFTGLIATRPGAPAAVDQQLQYLGSADAEGRRSFRLEGRL